MAFIRARFYIFYSVASLSTENNKRAREDSDTRDQACPIPSQIVFPRPRERQSTFSATFPETISDHMEANEAPSDCEVFTRLNSNNCEWLVRPSVAISEFASTLNRNLELLCERPTPLINKELFQENMNNLSTFLEKLEKFDSKQGKRNCKEKDITSIVETLLSEMPETANFMEECVLVGSAMYSMGIHYVVARALCNNPEEFAQRLNNSDSSDVDFKTKRGIKDMVQYLVDCCLKGKATHKQHIHKRRDLLAELRGDVIGRCNRDRWCI